MNVMKRFKYVIILCIIVLVGISVYGIAKYIVLKSYSSLDYVQSKEVATTERLPDTDTTEEPITITEVKNPSLEEYNLRVEGNLVAVDYSGRNAKVEPKQDDYYKERIQELNKLNGKDIASKVILPKSYYYGNYQEDYTKDINTFLKNYPDVLKMLNSLPNLDRYASKLPTKQPTPNVESTYKFYSISDFTIEEDGYASIDHAILIGVLQDRYYVYASDTENLVSCNKFIIVDKQDSLCVQQEDVEVLKQLGTIDSLSIPYRSCIPIKYEDKEFYLTRGY